MIHVTTTLNLKVRVLSNCNLVLVAVNNELVET